MSKKTKRQVRKAPVVEAPTIAPSTPTRTSDSGFNPDYSYVAKDLKRIGTLAISFFVILITLSFFLR